MYSKEQQAGRKIVEHKHVDDGPEAELQKSCEEYLTLRNIPFWRMPDHLQRYIQQKAPIQYKAMLSRYFLGKPDITILLPSGRYLNVELKSKKGRMTAGQKRFADRSELHLIRSFVDFVALIEKEME